MKKKLVRIICDVKIYELEDGTWSVEAKNIKPVVAKNFDDAWRIAVSYCE